MPYVLLILTIVVSGCAYNEPTAPSRLPQDDVKPPAVVAPPPVEPAPILLTLSVSPTPVQVRRTTHLSASVSGIAPTPPVEYRWTFGDGRTATSAESFLNHTYATVGTFQARVTATDAHGRTGEAATTVQVQAPAAAPPPPPPPPQAPPPSLSVTLTCTAKTSPTPSPCNVSASYSGQTVQSTDVGPVAWDWGDGTIIDASSSGPLKQHAYTQPGVYVVVATVTATTSDGAKTSSATKTLTIN
jgi:surface-anchored protein